MKRLPVFFTVLIVALLLISPLQQVLSQDTPPPTRAVNLEINGIDTTELPQAVVSVAVLDSRGQPVRGLTAADFTISGELADRAEIVSVENITDDNLAFGVVLAIDVSSSMAGPPIEQAKAAATAFVDSIAANDPVAVMTFGNDVRVVQDFTTDKDVLKRAIAAISFGGETNLYDGSVGSIEQANAAPVPRHTVIILSDGAHYLVAGRAENTRETALNTALTQGVPVYTIGLGYGTDRTYLQALAEGTNARYFESPTPEQLVEIYTDLAALFRSLYIVTLNVDVPLDGTEYTLEMQANTPFGESTVGQGTLRAPIPVPLVSIQQIEPAPDSPPNTLAFNVTVNSDDALTSGSYTLTNNDDDTAVTASDAIGGPADPGMNQFPLSLDPFVLPPGQTTLRVEITDENGDTGTAETGIEIPALPAVVSLTPDLAALGELSEITTLTVDLQEQSPTSTVQFLVDDEVISEDTEAPFVLELDPASFAPGQHTLSVNVESASGATITSEQTFSTAALPPEITVNGLTAGEVLEETRQVNVEVGGRVPVESVTYTLLGETLVQTEPPFNIELQPLNFVPDQPQTLRIEAANIFGTTNAVEIPFSFSMSPFLTATPPTSTPTFTPTPTIDAPATDSAATALAQTTLDAQATSDIQSTGTAVVEATANAASTENALSTESAIIAVTSTFEAEGTAAVQATVDAQTTATQEHRTEVAVTAAAVMELTQAAQTEIAGTEALAATDTQATADAEATVNADATVSADATEAAETEIATTEEVNAALTATEAAATAAQRTTAAEERAAIAAATQTATAELIGTDVAQTQAAATDAALTEAAETEAASTDAASTDAASTDVASTDVASTENAVTEVAGTSVAMLQLTSTADAEVTEEATEEIAPTDTPEPPTEEATEEAVPSATASFDPTATTGAPQEVVIPGSAQTLQDQLPILAVCGGLLILGLILLFILSRRRRNG